ncbi:hypothetical protein D3C75_759770 [compost metagenome]
MVSLFQQMSGTLDVDGFQLRPMATTLVIITEVGRGMEQDVAALQVFSEGGDVSHIACD